MATFNINSVAVNADGWSCYVVLAGQGAQAGNVSYDFGTPGSTDTSKFYMLVTSEGYDSDGNLTTIQRYVYGTAVVRKASPNEAQLDEINALGNLRVRVALSDCVYDDDKDGGAGTSGTDILVNVAAAWATIGANTNAAANNDTANNNSTQDYPKVIGQWRQVPYQKFSADPALRLSAFHRHGIARVGFTLTDVSANSATAAATSESVRQRTASGLYAPEYAAQVSMTSLTQGEILTARAQAYPLVGDADSVFDTNDLGITTDRNMLGVCSFKHWCDKNDSATVTRYVSTTGNDTTGDGSSGNPWATVEKALTDGSADDIELAAGTYVLGAVTAPSSIDRWRVVRPASGASVTVQINGAESYNTAHLKFEGVTIQAAGTTAWFDDSTGTRYLWFDNCTFDANGYGTPTVTRLAYRSAGAFVTESTIDNAASWGLGQNFAARIVHAFDGCVIASASPKRIVGCTYLVANELDDVGVRTKDLGSTTGPLEDPFVMLCNKLHSYSATADAPVELFKTSNCDTGIALIGNIIEKTAGTTQAVLISGDSTTNTTTNVLIWHNTIAGERANLAYNETGTTSTPQLLWSVVGNSLEEYNIKSDTFGTPSGNRVGNWPVLYGVGFCANGAEATIGFCNAFEGLYSSTIFGTSEGESATTPCSPAYTDDASLSGSGLGDGDYTPGDGSDLIDALPAGYAMVSYDMYGTAIGNTGGGEIGAVQLAAAGGGMSVTGARRRSGLLINHLKHKLI